MRVGDTMIHESIIGSRFYGRIVGTLQIGARMGVATTIKGRAWVTGLFNYFLDPSDPYPTGYIVADTWGRTTSLTQD